MLSKFGTVNLEMLKRALHDIWGQNAVINDVNIIDRPFDMFEMYVTLNKQYNILLSYDRSIVDISIQRNGKYEWLTDFAGQDVIEGFSSSRPENLLHNFKVLDKVLQSM